MSTLIGEEIVVVGVNRLLQLRSKDGGFSLKTGEMHRSDIDPPHAYGTLHLERYNVPAPRSDAERGHVKYGLTRREIVSLDEGDSETSASGIDGNSSSGSSSANDHEVEFSFSTFLGALEFSEHLRSRRRGPSRG